MAGRRKGDGRDLDRYKRDEFRRDVLRLLRVIYFYAFSPMAYLSALTLAIIVPLASDGEPLGLLGIWLWLSVAITIANILWWIGSFVNNKIQNYRADLEERAYIRMEEDRDEESDRDVK